jgi:biotin carboxylase
MHREIGGYIELNAPRGYCLHGEALALNSGRSCLEYLIKAREIRFIWLPDFMCSSVSDLCRKLGADVGVYAIGEDFAPIWDFSVENNQYLYLCDYYGQLEGSVIEKAMEVCGGRLIVDESQNLISKPHLGIDTLYSARKYLGVCDGGFLYTNARVKEALPEDASLEHIDYILGRIEAGAGAYYAESKENNERFADEGMKAMSKLTRVLLAKEDYAEINARRKANWKTLEHELGKYNPLKLKEPQSPFMYPFLVDNGPAVRAVLAKRGIFIPTLWPNVLEDTNHSSVAYNYAKNILPLPIDQRYNAGDMKAIVDALREEGFVPMELAGKKIAILGGTRISRQIVEAAKDLGMHTCVIDYYPPEKSPAKQIADEHALISVADIDDVASFLKDNSFDGVITGYTDSILGFYADVCEAAGLPCYGTRAQFETFTDKTKWKKLCREYGVPTATEYDVDELLSMASDELPLPLFIKPADGSGSRGVSVVRNASELVPAIENAKKFLKGGKVLAEDYLKGPEVTVFWLFINGEYHVYALGNRLVKNNQKGALPLPVGYTFPASVTPYYLESIAPCARAMFESQGIKNGMMFMQCIVRDGVPHVYDIGYRLTGSLEHHITRAVAGYSPIDMLLRYAVTGKMSDDSAIWDKVDAGLKSYAYNVSCLMAPGTLGHFEGLDAIEGDPTAIKYVKAHVEGETLPPEARGELRQIALRVLGVVNDARDLEPAMMRIQNAVRIVSDKGEDLMLPGLDATDFQGNVLIEECW